MPGGSEFQTAGAATLKPREAEVAYFYRRAKVPCVQNLEIVIVGFIVVIIQLQANSSVRQLSAC